MTIWNRGRNNRRYRPHGAIWLESRLSANVSLLPAMDDRTLVGQEDDAQLRRASRGTDRRHHTEVNRLEKEICNIGRILSPHRA